MRPWCAIFSLCGGLLLAAGCSERPHLVPVDGTVSLEGKPVTGMIIVFAPQGNTEGTGALGHVDDQGRFSLLDSRGGAGVHVGEYRIHFYPALKQNSAAEIDPSTDVVSTPGKVGVPGIYLDVSTSPLIAKIPEGGASVEIQLTNTGQGASAKAVARTGKG